MLEKIIISVIAAFLTSILTISVALRKHKDKHWWNKKLDLYLKILNEISEMRAICLELLDESNTPCKQRLKQLLYEWKHLMRELKKSQSMGYILLSDDAEHELTMLLVFLDSAEDRNRIHLLDEECEPYIFEADEKKEKLGRYHSLLKGIFKEDLGV